MRIAPIEEYSSSYFMLPSARVLNYSGEKVAAGQQFAAELGQFVRRDPVLKLGQGHYFLKPEHGIPQDTIAVPADSGIETDLDVVLMARDSTTSELRQRGMIQAP